MTKKVSEMDPNELLQEAFAVLDLIVAEFDSDPMSVQCFDLRIVARARDVMAEHKLRNSVASRFFGI